MNGLSHLEPDHSEFVEVDPTGRYGRYNEILGKGASKTVYRAFDEYDGIEVAWNQVKLYDFLQSPEDLERLYCEIHLLKTLKHKNIMKFYTSWVDTSKRNINFVTEMFTSGTLKQYRLKHKRVNIRAVKHWCRQILGGLLYLHGHDPPVIHRDLKCDNIFVNGNQGEVKIGDLGLAAILRKSQHAAQCVGTPEFMAPEVYEEEYNELVDIYSFGMCVLEMVTFEYPYSECTHPAQIYKKVVSGKKPDALYKVKDPEVRKFVEKCLAAASMRHSAIELLNDDFLRVDESEYDLRPVNYSRQLDDIGPLVRQPLYEVHQNDSSYSNGYSNGCGFDSQNEWGYNPFEAESSGIELFEHHDDDEHGGDVDISIRGKRKDEDGSIILRLRIADKEGHIRKIYFPFDIETDTALSVATEMVAELDITDHDVTEIADMIDGEVASLVPDWQSGPGIVETPHVSNQNGCQNCVSNHTSSGSFMDFLSNNLGTSQGCTHGCTSMHSRFEEITYQEDESKHHVEDLPNESSQSDCLHYQELWGQHESRELSSVGSGQSHSDEEYEKLNQFVTVMHDLKLDNAIVAIASDAKNCLRNLSGSHPISTVPSIYCDLSANSEHEIQKELRWLKAKHQIELRELRDQQLGLVLKSSTEEQERENGSLSCLVSSTMKGNNYDRNSSFNCLPSPKKSCPSLETQRVRKCEAILECPDAEEEDVGTANSFYTKSQLLPHSLCRTVSLPVDAVDS